MSDMMINDENIELLGIFASANTTQFESSADIYIYHSKNDEVVPYETALRAAQELKRQGNSVVMLADGVSHAAGKRRFALMTALAYLKSRVEWEPLEELLDILQPGILNSASTKQLSLSSIETSTEPQASSPTLSRDQVLNSISEIQSKLELQQM